MKRFLHLLLCLMFLSACSNSITEKDKKEIVSSENSQLEIDKTNKNLPVNISTPSQYKKTIEISIEENLILENLQNICSQPRKLGTEGEQIALKYLRGKLEEYGYITDIQDFSVYKQDWQSTHVKYHSDYFRENPYNSQILGTGKNLIATRDNHSNAKKTIYLTAHYDTTSNTTGVIDNGTGLNVILEVARQLKDYESPFNIVVVFFGGEEYFRTGSRAFVSNLTAVEKENTIGCINVDMVGEKDAGDLIMRANRGEHNILTLMLNDHMENQLAILDGGYSDDLSFYLGKLPAITLTNKEPVLSRDKEKEQLPYIDLPELKNTAYLLTDFLVHFDTNAYHKFLSRRSFAGNKAMPYRRSIVDGFKLININAHLLENGYDSATEYIYENENGKKYTITEKFKVFVDPAIYRSFQTLESNYGYNLYFVEHNAGNTTKIFYLIGMYFGEITGDISTDDALNILKSLV